MVSGVYSSGLSGSENMHSLSLQSGLLTLSAVVMLLGTWSCGTAVSCSCRLIKPVIPKILCTPGALLILKTGPPSWLHSITSNPYVCQLQFPMP